MPHSRRDITNAKLEYIQAAERFAAILSGALAAITNGIRAAQVVDEEPMVLPDQAVHRDSSIKALSEKIGG